MNNDTRLYHNPGCSKSRAALDVLRARGVEPRVIAYLDDPPTDAELGWLLKAMPGLSARDMVREGEPEFSALGLSPASSDEELIAAIARHPRLMERPIFVHQGRAVIGRPPERVLALLDNDTLK